MRHNNKKSENSVKCGSIWIFIIYTRKCSYCTVYYIMARTNVTKLCGFVRGGMWGEKKVPPNKTMDFIISCT